MAKPLKPEPKFFSRDDLYARGFTYYLSTWFSVSKPGSVAGEKSTSYLESSEAAARIQQCLPDVKLIFILRNPIDRAFSNYRWSRMNGYETRGFAQALAEEEQRDRAANSEMRRIKPYAYFARGLYAEMLKPYFDLFPRKQILCLRYEDIRSEPEILVSRLHSFLGIEPRPNDALELGVINASEVLCAEMDERVRKGLKQRYKQANQVLVELLENQFKIWE